MSETVDPEQPTLGASFAVLLGLTGFAFAQPMLSLAGANPTLFIFSRSDRVEIVVIALAIAFVPALVAGGLVAAATALHPTLARAIYRSLVGVVAFVAGVGMCREIGPGFVAVAGGGAAAALAVVAVVRGGAPAQWLRYTSILPFLALAVFFFGSESSALLRPLSSTERTDIVGETPSLIVLFLDELPTRSLLDESGGIDEARFPNFAALADDSTWYRNFAAMSGTTETAFPAMLTGREPRLSSPVWTNHPDNLFSLLAPTHHLTVHESFTRMCGVSTCTEAGPSGESVDTGSTKGALPQLLDLWKERLTGARTVGQAALDDFVESVADPKPQVISFEELGFFEPRYLEQWPTRFTGFIDALDPSPDPAFWFLHLLLPHVPWQFTPDGTLYGPPPSNTDLGPLNSIEWVSAVNEARHIRQVQYTDGLLGELVAQLEASGLYDSTTLVVVADHGVSFEPGTSNRDVSGAGRPGTAFAPLFVKRPGQTEGRVDDQNLMAVDFLPLMAELTNTEVEWDIDGAAPDSEAIAARGAEKRTYELEGSGGDRHLVGPLTYDGVVDFPTAADRWIRPWQEGDDDLEALLELLDHHDLIGARVADLATRDRGGLQVWNLGSLTRGDADIPPGLVQGRVDSELLPTEVLIAVDGTIVTGSKAYPIEGGTGFLALLPAELIGEPLDLEFVVVTTDGSLLTPAVASR